MLLNVGKVSGADTFEDRPAPCEIRWFVLGSLRLRGRPFKVAVVPLSPWSSGDMSLTACRCDGAPMEVGGIR